MEPVSYYAVYLAAGNSTRYHGNKLLAQIGEKPMFAWGLELLTGCIGAEKTIVVTQYDTIEKAALACGCECVRNPDSSRGIASSVILGMEKALRLAGGEDAAFLFLTADQPFLRKESLEKLLKQFGQSDCMMGCLGWQGEWYNPCVFHRKRAMELLTLTGDRGGKQVLRKYPEEVLCVEPETLAELTDIDEKRQLLSGHDLPQTQGCYNK